MINGKRIVLVLPAYNAAKTLEATVHEMPDTVDESILVDDHSSDETAEIARRMGVTVEVHPKNRGYGGNQKSGYAIALERGADVVVCSFPMMAFGVYDVALGSRNLGGGALRGGMPRCSILTTSSSTISFFRRHCCGAHASVGFPAPQDTSPKFDLRLGGLRTSLEYRLAKLGLYRAPYLQLPHSQHLAKS